MTEKWHALSLEDVTRTLEVTKDLIPPKAEVKGSDFLMELSDLKEVMTVNIASKEVVETPSLKGKIKIANKSKDVLDIKSLSVNKIMSHEFDLLS